LRTKKPNGHWLISVPPGTSWPNSCCPAALQARASSVTRASAAMLSWAAAGLAANAPVLANAAASARAYRPDLARVAYPRETPAVFRCCRPDCKRVVMQGLREGGPGSRRDEERHWHQSIIVENGGYNEIAG
jgi:hypothetical protein